MAVGQILLSLQNSSAQKVLWVLPLALEWEQDVPDDPQHGELSSLTWTRRAMGWVGMGWEEMREPDLT